MTDHESGAIEILLVEDNPGDVRLTREILKDGHIRNTLNAVEDGVEALAFPRREGEHTNMKQQDLILLDLDLPRKDGREVLAEIKADPELRRIPVVVLTTSSAERDVIAAYDLHANCYITKPVDRVDAESLTRASAYALGRQQADKAMVQEQDLLARAEEIAHLGSWHHDLTTGVVRWSDEMHRIFALDPSEPPADPVAAMLAAMHPEDRDRMRETISAGIADGTALDSPFRIIAPDGTVRWIDSHTRPEHDGRGAVVALAGFVQDITDLRLAEERTARNAVLDGAIAILASAMAKADPSIEDLSELILNDAKGLTHSLLGFVSVIEDGARVPAHEEAIETINSGRVMGSAALYRYAHPDGRHAKSAEPLFTDFPTSAGTLADEPAADVPITSFLSVPAMAEHRFIGQLAVANAPSYTDEDLETLTRLAGLYALALVGQEERVALVGSESSLRTSNLRFEHMVYDVAEAMGRIIEIRDPYTQGHEVRVAKLAVLIAREMRLPDADVDAIQMSGLVHDIGKLSIPAEILTKPGQLSDVEFALIKEHPEAGYKILKGINFPWPVAEIVLSHHERWDGTGYPNGLEGEEISLAARVIALSDVVEAMASHRPYRPALGLGAAVAELAAHPEKYDPEVASAFMVLYESGRVEFEDVA